MNDAAGENRMVADMLAEARGLRPEPGPDLVARILAGAEAERLARLHSTARPKPTRSAFWSMIGGWPGLAMLTTATLAGVWIGTYPPAALDPVAQAFLAGASTEADYAELVPGYDFFADEG